MFQSLENKEGKRDLQKNTQKKNKILSGGSKQNAAAYGSIHEKDSASPDQRLINTSRLRWEYGNHHIWDAPVQRQPVIQMYVRQTKTYDDSELEWEEGEEKAFWDTVDAGLAMAVDQLGKEIRKSSPESGHAKAVSDVLTDEKLKIYPMVDSGRVGQSAYGKKEISLEVNALNENVFEMAKTLIHEAFHIVGGCWQIDKSGSYVYDSNLDVGCTSQNAHWIYKTYLQGKERINIRADAFAQYIMLL